jgi:hypothetical protein
MHHTHDPWVALLLCRLLLFLEQRQLAVEETAAAGTPPHHHALLHHSRVAAPPCLCPLFVLCAPWGGVNFSSHQQLLTGRLTH